MNALVGLHSRLLAESWIEQADASSRATVWPGVEAAHKRWPRLSAGRLRRVVRWAHRLWDDDGLESPVAWAWTVSCRLADGRQGWLPIMNGEGPIGAYRVDGERWGQWVVRRLASAVDARGVLEVKVIHQWTAKRYETDLDGLYPSPIPLWAVEMDGQHAGTLRTASVQRGTVDHGWVAGADTCQQVRGKGIVGLLWDWARRRAIR